MLKNTHIWISSCVAQCINRFFEGKPKGPVHLMFCIADHFEPRWGRVSIDKEIERTDKWVRKCTAVLKKHKDCDGENPKYTLFYPIDEFTEPTFKKLSDFCHNGLAEIEVHLHHDDDNEYSLREKLSHAKHVFSKYGHLSIGANSEEIMYGFIHGNWSLDNSRKDGRLCGVNNELEVLSETGCYADFTLPSAPSDTQTAKINSIYYAKDTPRPKSHNQGMDVSVGVKQCGDLILIQGPLALNWKRRKFGMLPKIENGSISSNNLPTADRIDLWAKQKIAVKGRPEWIFVKVYTHGAQDGNLTDSFFDGLDSMFSYLETKYNDAINYKLHYVTARQMYNIVRAAEAGEPGEPGLYKDYALRLQVKNKYENKQ